MAIDFTLSPEQQALQADARAFADAVLSEVRGLIDPLPRPEDRFRDAAAMARALRATGATPRSGAVLAGVRTAGLATVLGLGIFLARLWRRDLRRPAGG